MSTLSELLTERTSLRVGAVEHLQRVVAEWQLLADLSFADLLLWIPLSDDRYLCAAQVRPTTSATAHPEDAVASTVTAEQYPQLHRAMVEGRICREEDPSWHLNVPIRREAIPVRDGNALLAVLSRDANLAMPRVPSPLEIAYLAGAADLCQMIADGTFPSTAPAVDSNLNPRAGDGLIRLDPDGRVVYASPNAQSAYHRMGRAADLVGADLAATTRELIPDPFDASVVASRIAVAVEGKPSLLAEAGAQGAVVLLRALPLRPRLEPVGALVLLRDVTELKRRDLALLSKDATIREIHHRVKNNLQTVAALLRLQARRTGNDEAKRVLRESVRRVNSIAVVHETLSMSVDEQVDLDGLVDKVIPMIGDVATAETRVSVHREGAFGVLAGALATPLVLVLTELVHNALAHAYAPGQHGEIVISANQEDGTLTVLVRDDGCGLPSGFDLDASAGLGLQIVRTLVDSELHATLSLAPGPQSGTLARLVIPVHAADLD